MGSRGRGREDGCEGGVNLVGLESVLGVWWEEAERRVKAGRGERRRGRRRRRRRRGIVDIVGGAIGELEISAGLSGGGETYFCQEDGKSREKP